MLCLCFVVVCIEMRAFRLPGKSGVSEIGKAKSEDLNLGTNTHTHTHTQKGLIQRINKT